MKLLRQKRSHLTRYQTRVAAMRRLLDRDVENRRARRGLCMTIIKPCRTDTAYHDAYAGNGARRCRVYLLASIIFKRIYWSLFINYGFITTITFQLVWPRHLRPMGVSASLQPYVPNKNSYHIRPEIPPASIKNCFFNSTRASVFSKCNVRSPTE